jgi:gingipain R
MKKIVTLIIAGLLTTISSAQEFSLLSSTNQKISIGHSFTEHSVQETSINGISHWDFDKSYNVTMKESGSPALPTFAESVIIPHTGSTSLVIEHDGFTEYSNVSITPSKGSLKRNINPEDVAYTFGDVYNTNAFYPAELVTISEPYNLRNTRGISVGFSPYQYNPVTKTLRVYQNIRAKVLINQTEEGINELTNAPVANDIFRNVYDQHFLNSNVVFGRYTPLEEEGEMLVICADEFTDEIDAFVKWKIQSGIKTTVTEVSTIGNTDTDIKAYIQNFYGSNPDLVYVVLVGDHQQVASHTYGISGSEDLWSDSYYGQMTGGTNDFYPELFVGRLSGSNGQQITTQVDRILEYEKTPASGDWMTKAIGLASDEGAGYGDDNEADWEHARNNRTKLLNFGYTEVHEFYDGSHGGGDASGNPSASIISPAVNDGLGLFNYTGHGDQNTCITGNYASSDINSATNNGKYPFVVSVACNNGTFTSGTCISETWARATNNGTPSGAIAACGSTILMAWAEPMQSQDEMADIIAENYANNRKATIGGIFFNAQMSVLEEYNNSTTAKEVMQTWVMFGDPSTMFRSQATMAMNVSHVGNVPGGTTSVDINCDVDDVKITIVQNDNIIGTGISSGGSVTITFDALVSNSMLTVTGVKQNYAPYQGNITVNGNVSIQENLIQSLDVYPNPASDVLNITWDNNSSVDKIEVIDLSGKVISTTKPGSSASSVKMNTEFISSGVYLLQLTSNGSKELRKIIIR